MIFIMKEIDVHCMIDFVLLRANHEPWNKITFLLRAFDLHDYANYSTQNA